LPNPDASKNARTAAPRVKMGFSKARTQTCRRETTFGLKTMMPPPGRNRKQAAFFKRAILRHRTGEPCLGKIPAVAGGVGSSHNALQN